MDDPLPPRIAEDADFVAMKRLIDNHDGWTMELAKPTTQVWTRSVDGCNFNMVKMSATFDGIPAEVVYDVLLDPDYRRDWDSNMLASVDIGCLNVNNDIGYYASKCVCLERIEEGVITNININLQFQWLVQLR